MITKDGGYFQIEEWVFGDWPWTAIEDLSLEDREDLERRYQENPKRMHAWLIDSGKWMIAAQLKIDHAVGRLAG
jgi:hypothetical protein